MNCKKGDLALRIDPGHYGQMFECLEFVGRFQFINGRVIEDAWLVKSLCSYRFTYGYEAAGPVVLASDIGHVSDSVLRPLPGPDAVRSFDAPVEVVTQ